MFLQNASTSDYQLGYKEEEPEPHRKHSTVQPRNTNFLGKKQKPETALAGWLSWLENVVYTPKSCRFDLQSGHVGGNQLTFLSHITVCLSLPLPSSLKSIKHPRVMI